MKGFAVAAAVVVIIVLAAGSYLLLRPSSSSSSSTSTQTTQPVQTMSSTVQSTSQTTTSLQLTGGPAQISVGATTCTASTGKCMVTLVNSGGTSANATGCTIDGQAGVFSPASAQVQPGKSVNVSCSPAPGGAIPIPGFHVEGTIALSDGSSAHYTGNWV
ncbi:MAG TPA: hypothetical protein VLX56_04405 [Nitrososphaerales archaeon]|nr:hypothetical protein [Nitrososphaerales archaeon]